MFGIVFDIDGTLLDTYELDERLYRQSILSEAPGAVIRESWHSYRESTDSGVLKEILDESGLSYDPYYEAVRQKFGLLVAQYLNTGGSCIAIKGAIQLLVDLKQKKK